MRTRTRSILISSFLVFAPFVVNAAGSLPGIVLYDQMNIPVVNAWYSDSTLLHPQSIGDSFQTTEMWSITSLAWRGVYQDNAV